MEALLNAGADVTQRNNDGLTPAALAGVKIFLPNESIPLSCIRFFFWGGGVGVGLYFRYLVSLTETYRFFFLIFPPISLYLVANGKRGLATLFGTHVGHSVVNRFVHQGKV